MVSPATVQPNLLASLEEGGYRVTGPRLDVLRHLDRKQEGFTAEELCDELPGVGRATVYRTLKILLKSGVICKLWSQESGLRYSGARVEHHHHTVCISCGTVGDFRHATIERLMRAIGGDISGQIVGHRIEFDILCQDCLAQAAG